MSQVLLVVDDLADWEPYYPSDQVISFDQYLSYENKSEQRVRVINLCSDYSYLSEGYYCSLLSEARGHHVIPSISVLSDLSNPLLYGLQLSELVKALNRVTAEQTDTGVLQFKSYFGQVENASLRPLARLLFERFPCPILGICMQLGKTREITRLEVIDHRSLNDDEETLFANALDTFSRKVWRPRKAPASARYDIAILVNPEETLPPSNASALKKFISAGKELEVDVELIHPHDYMRLPEFDALFIRETTAIDHHTYRFAKKAESEGLVVMDDPTSILRCTNKIYLADMFNRHRVPAPRTWVLYREKPEQLSAMAEALGFPVVIKIPDGSFSRGVVKVKDMDELQQKTSELFAESSLLLAQEFLYTDYDWRIGVLNQRAIYACRYYMVRNHWQIYRHDGEKKTASGGFDTLPTFEVPKHVLQAALKATRPIGNGFYGVDIKASDDKVYVIEVNDNPSIDSGVEDRYLGRELYSLIMQEFVRRIEERRSA